MTKKVRKTNSEPDKKGTVKNPYTVEEHSRCSQPGNGQKMDLWKNSAS